MFNLQSGKHFDALEQDKIDGKNAIPYALRDGATALLTKDRVAFNWFRPDGTRSRYASDDNARRECMDDLERVRRKLSDCL